MVRYNPKDHGHADSMNDLRDAAEAVRSAGRGGDTVLAHINPREAALLKAHGGSGTINPKTGLLEFDDDWGWYDPGPSYDYGPSISFDVPSYTYDPFAEWFPSSDPISNAINSVYSGYIDNLYNSMAGQDLYSYDPAASTLESNLQALVPSTVDTSTQFAPYDFADTSTPAPVVADPVTQVIQDLQDYSVPQPDTSTPAPVAQDIQPDQQQTAPQTPTSSFSLSDLLGISSAEAATNPPAPPASSGAADVLDAAKSAAQKGQLNEFLAQNDTAANVLSAYPKEFSDFQALNNSTLEAQGQQAIYSSQTGETKDVNASPYGGLSVKDSTGPIAMPSSPVADATPAPDTSVAPDTKTTPDTSIGSPLGTAFDFYNFPVGEPAPSDIPPSEGEAPPASTKETPVDTSPAPLGTAFDFYGLPVGEPAPSDVPPSSGEETPAPTEETPVDVSPSPDEAPPIEQAPVETPPSPNGSGSLDPNVFSFTPTPLDLSVAQQASGTTGMGPEISLPPPVDLVGATSVETAPSVSETSTPTPTPVVQPAPLPTLRQYLGAASDPYSYGFGSERQYYGAVPAATSAASLPSMSAPENTSIAAPIGQASTRPAQVPSDIVEQFGYNPAYPLPTTTSLGLPGLASGGYFDADQYFADGGLVTAQSTPAMPTMSSFPTMAFTDGAGPVGQIAQPPGLDPSDSVGFDGPTASPMAPSPAAAAPGLVALQQNIGAKNANASPVQAPVPQNPNVGYALGKGPLSNL